MMSRSVMLCCLLLLMEIGCITKSSPMRMCDDLSCDIQISQAGGEYTFYIYNSHLNTNKYFVVCSRIRTVTQNNQDNMCTLDGLFNDYTCFDLVPQTYSNANTFTTVAITKWNADSTLSSTTKNNLVTSTTLVGDVGNIQTKVKFTSLVQANTTYELYMGYVVNLQTDSRTKTGFFSSFSLSSQSGSDNLIVQKNVECFQFYFQSYVNINLVFYGGTIRGGNSTMFFSVLSYLTDSDGNLPLTSINLNVWIGISLAQSHAGRDMIAFISGSSTVLDLYSLYYNAPYLDDGPNVQGTNDVMSIADSNTYTKGGNSFYYSATAVRKYDTGDVMGDEIIMKKMNSSYCYAVAYNSGTGPFYPNGTTNKHDYFSCFTPNIELFQSNLVLTLVITLIMLHVLAF